MRWLFTLAYYVRSLFQRRKLDAQLSEEIQSHVAMATEANVAAGMSPEEARYAALREFGNISSVQERTRAEHGWVRLEQIWKDVCFAYRSLMRARGFSVTVILTLVVGIGIAAIIFSLTQPKLFEPLPFPDPERLVLFQLQDKVGPIMNGCFSAQFLAYQEQTSVFVEFAAVEQTQANMVVDAVPRVVTNLNVSADFFHALGIKPVLGRCFLPEEYRSGAANGVVISNQYWQEKFHAAPDVLGRQFTIDQQAYAIIGVLPVYDGFMTGDVYRPLVLKSNLADPFATYLTVVGRMNPGVTREQAMAALATVKLVGVPAWAEHFIAEKKIVLSGSISLVDTKPYWLLFAGGILLYVSACLNAMNLALARLFSRQRELGIRLALGGTRWQIARLLWFESMGLVSVACMIVLFSWRWYFPLISAMLSGSEISLDAQGKWWHVAWSNVLAPVVGLSLIAGVMIALVPVWRLLRTETNTALKEGGAACGESRRMARLRSALVVLQAAFAVILLIATGLLVRSFERLHRADFGFDPIGKVRVQITFPRDYNVEPAAKLALFERLSERLATLPGVKGATYGVGVLLYAEWEGDQVKLPDGTIRSVSGQQVAANFAQVTGLTVIKGRWFSDRAGASTGPAEAVINETMARQYFGDRDPIGQAIPNESHVIVGVVRDIKGELRTPVGLHYYYPAWVQPGFLSTLMLRLEADPPAEFSALVQRAIYQADPRLIASYTTSIDDSINNQMWSERFAYSVLKALTPIALGLAVIGLFTVLAYNVETRMREFGVRLALGAKPADLQRVVLKRGVGTAAIGVSLGIVTAIGLTRFMRSLLFETTPYDPVVFICVAILLLGSASLACWLPARRAAKVDPVIALRAE